METRARRVAAQPNRAKRETKTSFFIKEPMDMTFFILVLVILAIGLVMMFSASFATAYFEEGDSYYYIKRQLTFALLGCTIMVFTSKINYKYLKMVSWLFYGGSVVLLILVLLVGTGDGVEKRWLNLGFTTIQPSELAKLAVIILLAYYFSRNYQYLKKPVKGVLVPFMIIGLAAGLVLLEPHLSGAILILSVGLCMMIVAGCNFTLLSATGVVGAIGLYFFSMNTDYMRRRIEIWLHPESDPRGDGYQTLQSLYAIGSGGLTGLGLGQTRQKYLFLPAPQNDFVFSIVAEELGFIGCLIILALFAVLIYRGFVIAMRSDDKFGSFMVFGIVMRVAVQVLLNVAVVTNAIPVTGISLPFFSSGGTALVILLFEMGIVLSVSRQSNLTKT